MAVEVLAEAHGRAFRGLSAELGFASEGWEVAARRARRCGFIEAGLAKKLERLDTALAFARHVSRPKADDLFAGLEAQLQRAQGQGVVAAPQQKHQEQEEVERQKPAAEEAACVVAAALDTTRELEDQEETKQVQQVVLALV